MRRQAVHKGAVKTGHMRQFRKPNNIKSNVSHTIIDESMRAISPTDVAEALELHCYIPRPNDGPHRGKEGALSEPQTKGDYGNVLQSNVSWQREKG